MELSQLSLSMPAYNILKIPCFWKFQENWESLRRAETLFLSPVKRKARTRERTSARYLFIIKTCLRKAMHIGSGFWDFPKNVNNTSGHGNKNANSYFLIIKTSLAYFFFVLFKLLKNFKSNLEWNFKGRALKLSTGFPAGAAVFKRCWKSSCFRCPNRCWSALKRH